MTRVKVNRKDVLSEDELKSMFEAASKIEDPYRRARGKALISILRRTGKRRSEVASLEADDVKIVGSYLSLTFTLRKKRKKQILLTRREKQIPLDDPYVEHILEYEKVLKAVQPGCKYFFPSIQYIFGGGSKFKVDKHLSGRQVHNIVNGLNPNCWPHLFRETVGADVVRSDPSILSPFRVMRRLDLESHITAFKYMQRFAADIIEKETQSKT